MAKVPTQPASKNASAANKAPAEQVTSPKTVSRETVKSLHRYVDRIAIRLERADQQTQDNIKALHSAFSLLERQVASSAQSSAQGESKTQARSEALDAKVGQLADKLNKTVEQTRASIKVELAAALSSTNLDRLTTALGKAENQLTEMELEQAEALARINGHIAKMATAIDARFKREAELRQNELKAATNKLETTAAKLEQKIGDVETINGEAIRQIGNNIVDVTEKITSRADAQSAQLKARVMELAKQTEKDIGAGFEGIEKRLDILTDKQRHLDAYVDRSMTALGNRIDSLEYGLTALPSEDVPASAAASLGEAAMPNIADAFSPPVPPPANNSASNSVSNSANSPLDNPYLAAKNSLNQAQSQPPPQIQPEPVQPPHTPLKEIFGQKTSALDGTTSNSAPINGSPPPPSAAPAQSHAPMQVLAYQPPMAEPRLASQGYTSGQALAFDYQMPADTAYRPANPRPNPNGAIGAFNEAAISGPLSGGVPTEFMPESVPLDNFAAEDLPYENPAYGENPALSETPSGLSRPGQTDVKTRKKKTKKPRKAKKTPTSHRAAASGTGKGLITGRNLKVAALATALGALGYIGLRGYMGQPIGGTFFDKTQAAPATSTGSAPVSLEGIAPEGSNADDALSFSEPIGKYQDNGLLPPSKIKDRQAAQLTLEEAAKSGNPVAQFQRGVNFLEAGRKPEAVKLIRDAANQGLPAAQYRLAKLYEAGIGVAADPDTARKLTERAARQGNRIAMHDLALYFAEGRGGVKMDLAQAAKWFEMAAQYGVVDSQFNLGVLYESGQGVDKNPAKAYQWYTIAARQGDQFAQQRLGILSTQLLTEDIDAAVALADSFKPKTIDEAANGIFRDVPWAMPRAEQLKPSAEIVKDAQSLLSGLGYDAGGSDGAMGPKTRNAVLSFERASGLPETGQVSAQLIDRLQAASGA